jgi:hypothetical protein
MTKKIKYSWEEIEELILQDLESQNPNSVIDKYEVHPQLDGDETSVTEVVIYVSTKKRK